MRNRLDILEEAMREEWGKYELQIKQIPTHVQYKTNTCKTWGIDHGNHNTFQYKFDYGNSFSCFWDNSQWNL